MLRIGIRVTRWFEDQHLPEASLQAYVSGEVDPPAQAAMKAHLSACEICQERLGRVRVVHRLFQGMIPKEPDELAWRRIRERVRAQLESDAHPEAHTIDLFLGRRWLPAGIAALAAVALLVWFAPQHSRAPKPEAPIAIAPPLVEPIEHEEAQTVTSGALPLELTLASGESLRLAEHTRVTAAPGEGSVELRLESGDLDVTLPRRPSAESPFKVTTPVFNASARSSDFSVGYRAHEFSVTVRDGEVDVDGPSVGHRTVVVGERLEGVVEETSAKVAVRPKKLAPKKAIEAPAIDAPLAETPSEPTQFSSSSEGETKVEVVETPLDAIGEAWREASEAYYQRRDLGRAIERAKVAASARGRPEGRLARQLLCDAYIAKSQPTEAVEACGALLDGATGEESRSIHYTLATIYRAQLADCRQAIVHYNQAVVFGRATLLDDEVRLFRAGCALEVGDVDLAWRDVNALDGRAGRLARPAELEALKRRLNELVGTRPRASSPGRDGE
jgi:hypothetical protein